MGIIESTIEKLKTLDLKSVTDDEVLAYLRQFGNLAMMSITIHPGQFIIRARPDSEFINRDTEDQITYIKDSKIIPQYNRASWEGKPMFYGATTNGEQSYCEVMTIYEVTTLTEESEKGEDLSEFITMGKWRVQKDIQLTAIAHHEDFHANNTELKELHNVFLNFIKGNPDKESDYLKIATFLSSEFAKEVKSNERYNYKISACFSEIAVRNGLDGVIYPTAKDHGKGFNVALTSECVDDCLKLEKVVVWWLKKRDKQVLIQPYLYCDKFTDDGRFIWIDPGHWTPEFVAEMKLNGW